MEFSYALDLVFVPLLGIITVYGLCRAGRAEEKALFHSLAADGGAQESCGERVSRAGGVHRFHGESRRGAGAFGIVAAGAPSAFRQHQIFNSCGQKRLDGALQNGEIAVASHDDGNFFHAGLLKNIIS